jgi:hypothetical protein
VVLGSVPPEFNWDIIAELSGDPVVPEDFGNWDDGEVPE